VAEGGRAYLNTLGEELKRSNSSYLKHEIELKTREVETRAERIRKSCPKSDLSGRSVILTDDGIATGATFFAALQVIKAEQGLETLVAVPVLLQSTFKKLTKQVDKVVYLESPRDFDAVGQFYETFEEVPFEVVEKLLGSYCSDDMKNPKKPMDC
jgi:predicted phosphoribosyltransferase